MANGHGDPSDPRTLPGQQADAQDNWIWEAHENMQADLESTNTQAQSLPDPPHPINWNTLTAHEARAEWFALDRWVNWLRRTYALPPSILPPYWHRHPELVWELSALHLHWLGAFDPEQHGSGPIGWHRDFADARNRLREWVSLSGTTLNADRPSRQPLWPGEKEASHQEGETAITDRTADFKAFVQADAARRGKARPGVHGRTWRHQ